MGLYSRRDSPFWWMKHTPADGGKPISESTRVPRRGAHAEQTRNLRKQAEEIDAMRAAAVAKAANGLAPASKKRRPTITFNSYCDWYEQHVSIDKPGAFRESQMLPVFKRFFGSVTDAETGGAREVLLHEVTRTKVKEFRRQRRRDDKVRASTVNRELNLLKHMMQEACPDYLRRSPIEKLRKLKERPFSARALTTEEEPRLLAELPLADRVMVICGMDTLMRLGNLFDLEWSHVQAEYIDIPTSKNGEPYRVPISRRLAAALALLPRTADYVFPHRRVAHSLPDRRKAVRLMLKRACRRAGIPYGQRVEGGGITWHSLTRHTGTTRMVDQGVHLLTIKEVGAWKTLSQLQRYSHPSESAKRVGVEAVAAALVPKTAETTTDARAVVDITHRVRHRPDLEQVQADAIAAVKRLIAEIAARPAADLAHVTIQLRGSYAVRATDDIAAKRA